MECKLSDEEKEVVEQALDQATNSDEQHDDRQEEAVVEAPKARKDAEYNWNEARRKMADLERRTQEQQELINKLSAQKSDEPELSPDDLLTVAHLNKVNARRDQDYLRELQRQKEEILRLRYPDIDQVLSNENIALFEQTEPELAETLATMQGDPVKLRTAAYKLIKKSLKPEHAPNSEKQRAEQNAKKPMSVQSAGKSSALGNVHQFENGLTPELRKQLYEEMTEAAKRY
jgi:hypothetical protein